MTNNAVPSPPRTDAGNAGRRCPDDLWALGEKAVARARRWADESASEPVPRSAKLLSRILSDPEGLTFEVGHIKGAGGRLQVRVSLVVERDSQKAIIIGKGGRRLKEVGVTARKGIEQLLGRKVYLDLHVRTAKDWQSDPKALARLGF